MPDIFPGNPLVPGVILTEALAQTAGIAAASGFQEDARPLFLLSAIRGMKFFAAVRPEEEILLHAEKLAQVDELCNLKSAATVGGKIVAEGQLVLNRTGQTSSAAIGIAPPCCPLLSLRDFRALCALPEYRDHYSRLRRGRLHRRGAG